MSTQVYFLCIHNQCRSQIAEAFMQKYADADIMTASAGVDGATRVHPMTIQVMKEVGIDISQAQSKKINMKYFMSSNVIVKVCEDTNERCPIVPFGIINFQWDIPNPIPTDGAEPDMHVMRQTRDDIERRVHALLQDIKHRTFR